MCGIFGALKFSGYFNDKDYRKFIELTDLVSYRGPDAKGYITFNLKDNIFNSREKFDLFFGHRRLSIIDLSERANQPMSDGEGLWIIYNGEIFNYLELKKELIQKGYTFKTNTDTEVILKVFREWGSLGFNKLNGMWAFALLDLLNRKVILSRDRFSIKPLYYYMPDDNTLYFGSEIKQLLPLLSEKKINKKVMFVFLQQGLLDYNEQTFFEGIIKLQPKTNLIIDFMENKIQNEQYWDYEIEEVFNINFAIEKFRELFFDSVRIRLRSDVSIGALLSGGLDSSSITVIANNFMNESLTAFSVVSTDKRYSEEKFIDILHSVKNIKVKKLFFEPRIVLDFIDDVIYHNDEPFGSLSVVAQYSILKKIKEKSDIIVVLSGQGGDEILMGYLKYFFFYLKELLIRKSFISAIKEVFLSLSNRTIIWQFNIKEAKRYIPYLNRNKNYLIVKETFEPIWKYNTLQERQILDIDKYSVPALTHYEDRNSMAHSLEIRLPFLDHRLVSFVLSLPVSFKLNNGWSKYILRKSMYELPYEIRWRKDKQGFITPEELWLKKDFSKLINHIFTKKSFLAEMGIIDSKAFLDYYKKFQSGDKMIYYGDISRVLIAELWARIFFR